MARKKIEEPEEELDEEYSDSALLPVLEYLHSKRGHEVVTRILDIVEDLKKATLDKNTKSFITQFKWLTIIQVVIVAGAMGAATYLTVQDKFTTTISLFLGTVMGYFFGKKS